MSRSNNARQRETIQDRIARINQSFSAIDYNSGRYIVLESQPSPDAEIRDFQQELRACTEGAVTGSDGVQYSDAQVLRVKTIIDRFRGREGLTELDRRWTEKVSDVRNWFLFAASERWRASTANMSTTPILGANLVGRRKSWPTRFLPPVSLTNSVLNGERSVPAPSVLS